MKQSAVIKEAVIKPKLMAAITRVTLRWRKNKKINPTIETPTEMYANTW